MDYQVTVEIPRFIDGKQIPSAWIDVLCDEGTMWRFTAVLVDGIKYENADDISLLIKAYGGVKRITKIANELARKEFDRLGYQIPKLAGRAG